MDRLSLFRGFFLRFGCGCQLVCGCGGLLGSRLLSDGDIFPVEPPQKGLHVGVVLLHVREGLLDVFQRDFLVWFVDGACLVLSGTVMLDLFTCFLDFGEA